MSTWQRKRRGLLEPLDRISPPLVTNRSPGKKLLDGPPRVPKSMSLYRVFCAASCTGNARAASNVIAVMHINVLDFTVTSLFGLRISQRADWVIPFLPGYLCGCAPNLRRHGVEPTDCSNCLIASGDTPGLAVAGMFAPGILVATFTVALASTRL